MLTYGCSSASCSAFRRSRPLHSSLLSRGGRSHYNLLFHIILGGVDLRAFRHSAFLPLVIRETPLRRCRGRASARSCNTPFSALRRALESRKCAKRHAAGGSIRNTRRASQEPENTICIHSRRKCLCPSTRGPDTSPGNRERSTAAGRVRPAPRRCPRTYLAAHRAFSQDARDHCRETPGARR